MTSRQEIIERIYSRQSDLKKLGVQHAYLFGSYATQQNRPDSDIDVAVVFSNGIYKHTLDRYGAQQRISDILSSLLLKEVSVSDAQQLRPDVFDDFLRGNIRVF